MPCPPGEHSVCLPSFFLSLSFLCVAVGGYIVAPIMSGGEEVEPTVKSVVIFAYSYST
jgi:hypothetical protein